jgi:hypothetical protein
LIDKTEDEELLNILKEDIISYRKEAEEIDDLSDLTPEEKAELEDSIYEDPEKDIVNEEKFKNYLLEWKKKLSTKSDSQII